MKLFQCIETPYMNLTKDDVVKILNTSKQNANKKNNKGYYVYNGIVVRGINGYFYRYNDPTEIFQEHKDPLQKIQNDNVDIKLYSGRDKDNTEEYGISASTSFNTAKAYATN